MRRVGAYVVLFALAVAAGAHSGRVASAHAAFTDTAPVSATTFTALTVPAMGSLTCGGTTTLASIGWAAVPGATGYRITRPDLTTVDVGLVTSWNTTGITLAATYWVRPLIAGWSGTPTSITPLLGLGNLVVCL